ncbi:MAG: thioredoxin domain-containing protein [Patescibacteria group bacterium]
MEPSTPQQSIAIPIAIVIGFGLIAAAIFFTGSSSGPALPLVGEQPAEPAAAPIAGEPRPVDENDHIRGNPNAQILLVEYSDFDCPFCKNFHDTMNRVMAEYGLNGEVAWVYRHFPLQQLHPNAPLIAHASECVAELGGNDAFWAFSDFVFNERGTNEPTNMLRLEEFATRAGVDAAAFTSCQESGRHQEAVTDDFQDAVAAGGQGTPHTIVIVGDQQAVINGAQPYGQVAATLDTILAQLDGVSAEEAAQ